jgi:UDP-N-acetylmuramyl pentapeptide phosphotransferase/UDP-N-acetylglucosamine-1-phosphate transferase
MSKVDSVMLLLILVVVGGLTWWCTGWLAHRDATVGLFDLPNERSLHQVPTPRTGGLAIIGSVLVGLVAAALGGAWPTSQGPTGWYGWPTSFWIVGLTSLLAVVSFVDDRRGLPIVVRFGVHVAAAVILTVGAQLVVSRIEVPRLGTIELGWFSLLVSIGFLVWMTNLYNFMDGMDGFAGGMTLLGAGFLASLAWRGEHRLILVLSLLLAVAALGFLVHNFPPAKIFMGDVGSVPTGFLIGALILVGCRDRLFTVWVPLMVFSPFIVDATATLIRRAAQGQRVWIAHRAHYYQRLVLLGWGHRKTVLAEYGLMVLCGALAWAYQIADDSVRPFILGSWGLLMVSAMWAVHVAEHLVGPLRTEN